MSHRMSTPPQSPIEILDDLRRRYGMDEVAEILTPRLKEIQ